MKGMIVLTMAAGLMAGCSGDPEGQNTGAADVETGSGVNYDRGGAPQEIAVSDLDWRRGVTNETQAGTGHPRPEATNKIAGEKR